LIHAFALEPRLVATWGQRNEFRFVHDKFGLGTPRALFELPSFSKWKRAVYAAAMELQLSEEDLKRVEELFRIFSEHKSRRAGAVYDGLLTWLDNAEREYDRKPFAAVLATENPRGHRAVLVSEQLASTEARWACSTGVMAERTPEALAAALSAMLVNCRVLHLVDPHFGPENARHRRVLEALMQLLAAQGLVPELIRVHCSEKSPLSFFEGEATRMADRLPEGLTVEFVRWRERNGGERLHNRYVLTDLGGVALGVGLDAGGRGQTDDFLLLPRAIYARRWSQYVDNDGAFEQADLPTPVRGTRRMRVR
jgi:hypothetical protein